jgi:beta-lactamase superfamily II metal-dependent hydrolase
MENTYVVWDETRECVVIDAGNMTARDDAQLIDFIREHALKPVLAVNTHGHFDHVSGVAYLKECYGVKFACSSKDSFLVEGAAQQGAMFGLQCRPAPAIDIDLDAVESIKFGNTTLQIIKTPGHTPGHVSLFNAEQRVLFTGDVSQEREEVLLEEWKRQSGRPVDVLKVAHHGSRFSTSAEFLKVINPGIAVISCGRNNLYGHPHAEVLERLEKVGSEVLTTPQYGAITIEVSLGEGVSVSYWGNGE